MLNSENLPWWKQTVFYECYVRSFQDSNNDGIGDIKGIISRLDYLRGLGIGALWLTPVYASPMVDNGYDVADYYNIDPMFGTLQDMELLISEARKRDIKIVMDLVVNHTSNKNKWFLESSSDRNNSKADWYIWKNGVKGTVPNNWRGIFGGSAWTWNETRQQFYLHTFAAEQPDLNWANPKVRLAIFDIVNFWLKKGIAGFRVDAITYIKKPESFADGKPDSNGMSDIHKMTANTTGILEYLGELNSEVRKFQDIVMVGEANGVSSDELKYWVGNNGVFDMIFQFDHIDMDFPNTEIASRDMKWDFSAWKKILNTAQHATEKEGWHPIFFENHDLPRAINHFFPEGADPVLCAKAIGLLNMTLRGTPFLYQGQEIGLENVEWHDISMYDDIRTKGEYKEAIQQGYSKEQALKKVRKFSRDNARTPMQWNSKTNAGFSNATPWLPLHHDYTEQNVEVQSKDPKSVLLWYRKLVSLRLEKKVLIEGDYEALLKDNEQIFAFARTMDNSRITVLINFSGKDAFFSSEIIKGAKNFLSNYGDFSNAGRLRPFEAALFEL